MAALLGTSFFSGRLWCGNFCPHGESVRQYQEGQFILIKIQNEPVQFRAYSLSLANEDDRTIKVIIKKVKNGYGRDIIFRFRKGDQGTLEGPLGNHLVPAEDTKKMLFIANGIGITAFLGLIRDSLNGRSGLESVKLLNGQHHIRDFIYHDHFKACEDNHPVLNTTQPLPGKTGQALIGATRRNF